MKVHKHPGRWPGACVSAILLVVLALPLLTPVIAEAAAPYTPANVLPADGATGISLTCTIASSAFNDSDEGDTHFASHWQITTISGDYTSPLFNSVDAINKTSIAISSGTLSYNTTYYWHVKHQDNHGNWSYWSIETSFTTVDSEPPDTPDNVSPAAGAVDIGLTPALESSDFADPDEGDAHTASRWQIRTDSGSYDSPIFDSGVSTSSKTSIAITSGYLEYGTIYYWHVKYQDSYGKWSEWSTETSFTTIADTTAPVISGVSSSGITSTTATITWTTDEPATSRAEYGITMSYGSTSEDTTLVTSHSVILSGLTPGTGYHYRVKSRDASDNEGDSADNTFTTSVACAPSPPGNVSPAEGAVEITLIPTLELSAFSDSDAGDTHTASQWQITTTSGNYGSPAYDSGTDTTNKTIIIVPSGELSYSMEYYWHVRYKDSYGNWSGYSTETSFTTISNSIPDKPTNSSPASAATGISLTPMLTGSAFYDSNDDDTHAASQWQITITSGNYGSPAYDSGTDTSNKTSIAIPPGKLIYGTEYYWHVKYQDSYGNWSAYSSETSFTTAVLHSPGQPIASSPSNKATGIGLTPTLESSAFSDPDDTHTASQWQMMTETGNYDSLVYDSGTDTSNKTSITIPSGTLSYNTTYYWRVRYQDSHGRWSSYSAEVSFTTVEATAAQGGGVPGYLWVVIAVVVSGGGALLWYVRSRSNPAQPS